MGIPEIDEILIWSLKFKLFKGGRKNITEMWIFFSVKILMTSVGSVECAECHSYWGTFFTTGEIAFTSTNAKALKIPG